MKSAMTVLAVRLLTILVVVALATLAISALMHRSPDDGPRAGRGAPAAAAPGTGSGSGSSGSSANTASTASSHSRDGSGSGAASPASAPAQMVIAPGRNGTDFSPSHEPWRDVLAAGTDTATALKIANGSNNAAGQAGCSSCHGAQGIPEAGASFPALAGSSSEYLAKQLLDYRSGTRRNVIMEGVAKGLDDAEIGALARYYASLPAPPLPAASVAGGRGQQLHEFGDNGLALAACANCHGARGSGESPLLPRLAGQPNDYFNSQMEAFRNSTRTNDDVGTMQAIARRLTPADTAALAQYYSGQSR